MNILYDNLIDKSSIFDKLSTHILISNVIIIKNDPVNKSNRLIQNYNGKKDYEALDNIIDTAYKYRDNLVHLKKHFDNSFMRAKNKKVTLNLYKKLTDACVKCKFFLTISDYENKSTSFLGKKKKRDDKEDIDEVF